MSDVVPVFPKWVPFGCGTASVALLCVLFASGAFFASGGIGRALDLLFGQLEKEMTSAYATDVTADQKRALGDAMAGLRGDIRADRVKLPAIQPLLGSMRDMLADGKLTHGEVEKLVDQIHNAEHPPPSIAK
ncbi:MAG: hypothetical protein ABI837_09620 [Acidobacteriota bacterium]